MTVRISHRIPPHAQVNAVSRAIAEMRRHRTPLIDLTESNPTRAGLPYPERLLESLSDDRGLLYDPHPLGLRVAREAIAADCARRGAQVDPNHVVLSASTSETYSWLFKLLCDPGDCVLTPRPSYPLFEHLTQLEGLRAIPYDLEYHGRWTVDLSRAADAPPETRALLVVSPNNPTGSYLSAGELESMVELCGQRGWALIADEVFADYALDAAAPLTDIASRAGVLSFTLGGASKTLGLPQVKLGWVVAGGPDRDRDAALAALEIVADAFLSVSTPVQLAAPSLIAAGGSIRSAIAERTRRNLQAARDAARRYPSCEVLRVEGGWSAVVRVPATRSEEALVLELLARDRILVHPGYFFEFPHEAFIVISLLPPEATFSEAIELVLRRAATQP